MSANEPGPEPMSALPATGRAESALEPEDVDRVASRAAQAPAGEPLGDRAGVRFRRPWKLATGLLSLLAICLVPAVVGVVIYLDRQRETALHDSYRTAVLVAVGTSEQLRWLLLDAQAMLASVAARPKVLAADPADCDPTLAEFSAINPAYKTLALRLPDGRSLCSELRQPPSQNSVQASPWFQAAIRQPGFHASDGHHDHRHEAMPQGAHSHSHRHEPLHHAHPHVPDAHHGHRH